MRVMPKNMQIACLKRWFLTWNKWRDEERGYDVSTKLAEIDWNNFVTEGQTLSENLNDLKNNYPEYSWAKDDNYEAKEEVAVLNLQAQMEEQAKVDTERHEAQYQEEQAQSTDNLDKVHEPISVEPPLGEWQIEKTETAEVHTIFVEIKPHKVHAKGKDYYCGRIQQTISGDFLGLRAKIIVEVPKL